MPELPEVETIARSLSQGRGAGFSILGHMIRDVSILWERSIAVPSAQEFSQRICGQTIRETGRRGKYLVVRLSTDTLLFHLRMSGDLYVRPAAVQDGNQIPAKHDRVILWLENGKSLVFEDARKFGRVWLLADPEEELGKLGPEPLSENFKADEFHRMLQGSRRQLKPLLMDQTFLAGLGNIYTDEALHRAKLHPLSTASALSGEQAATLLRAIQETLQEGIRRNGASIDWIYRGGDFQNQFRVYGRKGEACATCGASIERIVVGQRGTHFCPSCQKKIAG